MDGCIPTSFRLSAASRLASRTISLTFCCLLAVIAAGCARHLSREEAANKIKAHEFFRTQRTLSLQNGEFCVPIDFADPSGDFEAFLARKHHEETALGRRHGLLDVRSRKHQAAEAFFGKWPKACDRAATQFANSAGGGFGGSLVAAGLTYWYWTQKISQKAIESGVNANGDTLSTATVAFIGVTGLSENADKTTDADFTWKWDVTDIGRKFNVSPEFTGPATGIATFKLYDDGWRLERFQRTKG